MPEVEGTESNELHRSIACDKPDVKFQLKKSLPSGLNYSSTVVILLSVGFHSPVSWVIVIC